MVEEVGSVGLVAVGGVIGLIDYIDRTVLNHHEAERTLRRLIGSGLVEEVAACSVGPPKAKVSTHCAPRPRPEKGSATSRLTCRRQSSAPRPSFPSPESAMLELAFDCPSRVLIRRCWSLHSTQSSNGNVGCE